MNELGLRIVGGENGLNILETRSPATATKSVVMDSSCVTNITTALLLVAGMGTRLQPLTLNSPKCLTEVGGIPILERLITNLRAQGFERLVVVIGHLGEHIQEFLKKCAGDMQVDYVVNPDYRTTNNIYSLWLARLEIHEPFLLVETDLVFAPWMLNDMLQPGRMAVSNRLPWMNGTTVELGADREVTAFRMGGDLCDDSLQYKTVNLYSLSLTSWEKVIKTLGRFVTEGRLGDYYETVFAEMVADGTLAFDSVLFDKNRWYEVDTMVDLSEAELMFPCAV